MKVICAYGPQMGKTDCEKGQFYNETACECDLQNPGEMIFGLENFLGRRIDGFEGVHGGNEIGKINIEGRRLLKFCAEM